MPPRIRHILNKLALVLIACALLSIGLFCVAAEIMPTNAAGEQSDAVNQGLTITPSYFLNCWKCPATLTNTSDAKIIWIANEKGKGTKNISFSPPGGTLLPKRSVSVTITIEQVSCPASATFYFNTTTAFWNCTPPSPSPSPSPTPTPSPTPSPTPRPGTTPTAGSNNLTPTPTTGSIIPTTSPTAAQTPLPQGPLPAATATARAKRTPTGSTQSAGGGPPTTGANTGGPSTGMMVTYAALALALLAFLLYLIPRGQTPLPVKLLSLVLPSAVARRFGARQ